MYGKGWEPQSNGESHRAENHWGQWWASYCGSWGTAGLNSLPVCSMRTVVWAPGKNTYCFYILTGHPEQSIVICVETFTALTVCFSSVQFSPSVVSDSATPWTAAHQASLSITNSQSLLKLMSIESVMTSNHLILCRPLLLLPSIFPSIRVFSKNSVLCITWPKYWSFSVSPSNEYSGLICFRMDWFDLPPVQRTLKSLLQHHSSKASILQCSAFFMIQFSHPYMTIGKTIALTRWTLVSKVIFLLFNMLSRLVIDFLSRSKRLLISWLQSPSAVILEPKIMTVCLYNPKAKSFQVLLTMYFFGVSWMLWIRPTCRNLNALYCSTMCHTSSHSTQCSTQQVLLLWLTFLSVVKNKLHSFIKVRRIV